VAVRQRTFALAQTPYVVGLDESRHGNFNRLQYNNFEEAMNRHSAAPELVIAATPVSLVPEHVLRVARTVDGERNVLFTDVGSTKESICTRLEQSPFPKGCRFIGSHPIAGKEKSGVEHASADLFENRLTVITPTASARDQDVRLLVRFWRSLGSSVATMSPAEHDRTLARTSHLPHLLSALLADQLQEQDANYTGPGYHSVTRLALGSPEVWRDIVESNTQAILETLLDYEHALRNLRETIERGDMDAMTQFLERAKRNRGKLESDGDSHGGRDV
jgi:prephenate dehydrogenase